jgi:tetratricopeptide (TPR) repeat protein
MSHFIKNQAIFRSLFILIALLNIYSSLNGQATGDPKEDFLYGEYYLVRGMYHEALTFFLSALEVNPDNSNLNYRLGLCYSKTIGEQHKALPYLQKSVAEITKHYIDGKYTNTAAPIEAWLLLGDAYLRDDRLVEASKAYHEYKNLIGDPEDERYKEIMHRISGLGISYEFQRDNAEICLINIGKKVNSRFSDYNPVVSGDQKVLVYSQFWDSYDKILITRLNETGWTQPVDISSQIQTEGVCYTSAISYDGNELYLVCHDELNYDLFISKYENGVWNKLKPIGGKVNSRYRESSVCVSADGKSLYFASDRPGGFGGFDLYYAEKVGSEWSNISNLGKPINTKGNEEAPYVSADGTVLFFSSNGHESVGNMDIMYSDLDETNTWQEPKNIGTPVNTTNDDIFYSFFKDTRTGYLSRDIPEGFGKNDIYIVQYGDCPVLASGEVVINAKNKKETEHTAGNIIASEEAGTSNRNENINSTNSLTEISDSASFLTGNHEANSEPFDAKVDTVVTDYNFIEKQLEEALDDHQAGKEFADSAEEVYDSLSTYTIQLYALQKPLNMKKMKITPLKVSFGNDGLYRYTYGEFTGYYEARKKLDEMWISGYPDAFIRNITTVPNYAY